jgi:hypothetical protein
MKKLLLAISIVLSLTSCKKNDAGCGTCQGTGTVNCDSNGCTYILPILFDDGHFSNVSVNENTWTNTLEGERICF